GIYLIHFRSDVVERAVGKLPFELSRTNKLVFSITYFSLNLLRFDVLGIVIVFPQNLFDQVFRVVAVVDGIVGIVTNFFGFKSQYFGEYRMKRTHPQPRCITVDKLPDSPLHFPGCLIGKSEREYLVRTGNSLFNEVSNAISEDARFTAAGAGNNKQRTFSML